MHEAECLKEADSLRFSEERGFMHHGVSTDPTKVHKTKDLLEPNTNISYDGKATAIISNHNDSTIEKTANRIVFGCVGSDSTISYYGVSHSIPLLIDKSVTKRQKVSVK